MDNEPCVYLLRCADNALYVGASRDLEKRLWEHQTGFYRNAFTASRRPVLLVASFPFPSYEQALVAEKTMKRWTRAKKLAFARGDVETFHQLSKTPKERRRLAKKSGEDSTT